jgi:hypothetical protein
MLHQVTVGFGVLIHISLKYKVDERMLQYAVYYPWRHAYVLHPVILFFPRSIFNFEEWFR